MKKIIELAEKLYEQFPHSGTKGGALYFGELIEDLHNTLVEYKRLQQTSITEEWLKEHGFEKENGEWQLMSDTYFVAIRKYGKNSEHSGKMRVHINGANCMIEHLATNNLADLLDACELCGIKMEG